MLSQRRFGVEIECGYPDGGCDGASALLRKNGIRPLSVGWDGSGVEVRSPVLRGTSGLAWLKECMECLREHGAYVGTPDGMHVHHEGVPGYHVVATPVNGGRNTKVLSPVHILRLVKSWSNNNHLIELLVNEYRRNNVSYCNKVWSGGQSRQYQKAAEKLEFPGKYSDLNLRSLHSSKGTIEIRLHEGTLDFEEAEGWIRFGQSFLDTAATSERPIPKQKDLGALLDLLGLPQVIKKRLHEKANRNGTPSKNSGFDPNADDDDDDGGW